MAQRFDPIKGFVDDDVSNPGAPSAPQASFAAQSTAAPQRFGISNPGSTNFAGPSNDDEGMGSAFVRGAKGSILGLKEAAYGVAGLAGDAIGADSLRDYGRQGALETEDQIQQGSQPSDSFKSAFIDGDGSKANWAAYAAGYAISELAQAIVTGGAGSFIAKTAAKKGVVLVTEKAIQKQAEELAAKGAVEELMAKGATEEVANAAIKQQATQDVVQHIGFTLGMGADSFIQHTGTDYADASKDGQDLSGLDLARIAAGGLAGAAIDTFTNSVAVNRFLRPAEGVGIRRAVAQGAAGQASLGGVTAIGQQVISQWAGGKGVSTDWRDYVDSAMSGALGGAVIGGTMEAAGKAFRGGKAKTEEQPATDQTEQTPPTDETVRTSNQGDAVPAIQGRDEAATTKLAANDAEAGDIAANEQPPAGGTEDLAAIQQRGMEALRAPQRDFQRTMADQDQAEAQAPRPTEAGALPVEKTIARAEDAVPQAPTPKPVSIESLGGSPEGTIVKVADPSRADLSGRVGVLTSQGHVWIDGTTYAIDPATKITIPTAQEASRVPANWRRMTPEEVAAYHQESAPAVEQTPAQQKPAEAAPAPASQAPVAEQAPPAEQTVKTNKRAKTPKTEAEAQPEQTDQAVVSADDLVSTPKAEVEPFGAWAMNEHGLDTDGLAKLKAGERGVLESQYQSYVDGFNKGAEKSAPAESPGQPGLKSSEGSPTEAAGSRPASIPEKLPGKSALSIEGESPSGEKRTVEFRMDKGQLKGAVIHSVGEEGPAMLDYVRAQKGDSIKSLASRIRDRFIPQQEVDAKAASKRIAEQRAQAKKDAASRANLERLKEKMTGEPANITPEEARASELLNRKKAERESASKTGEIARLSRQAIPEEDRVNAEMAEAHGLDDKSFAFVDPPEALKAQAANLERIFPMKIQFYKALNERADDIGDGFFIKRVSDSTIYVNERTQNPFEFVAGHEFAHSIRARSPKLWSEFVSRIEDSGLRDMPEYKRQVEALGKSMVQESRDAGRKVPGAKAMADTIREEMHADLVGSMLMRPQFLERLSNTAKPELRTVFQKVIQALKDYLEGLKAKISEKGLRGGRAFKTVVDTERAVADLLNKFSGIRDENDTNLKADAEKFWRDQAQSDVPFESLNDNLRERWTDAYESYREGDMDGKQLVKEIGDIEVIHARNERTARQTKPREVDAADEVNHNFVAPEKVNDAKQATAEAAPAASAGDAVREAVDRRGDQGQSGPYERASPGRTSVDVAGRSAKVVATFKPDEATRAWVTERGGTTPDIHEVTGEPAAFRDAVNAAKEKNEFGSAVTLYPEEDYAGMRLFLTDDGKAGFALKGNDIVSVFRHPESLDKGFTLGALRLAVAQGGRKLDAFDTMLPRLYAKNGFRAVSRMKFDENFAPPGWNPETYKAFNDGRPDVVFMAHDPSYTGGYSRRSGKLFTDYDAAVKHQDSMVETFNGPSASGGPQLSRKAAVVDPGKNKVLAEALRKTGNNKEQTPLRQRLSEIAERAKTEWVQRVFDRYAPIKKLDPYSYVLARMSDSSDGALQTMLTSGKPFLDADGALDLNHGKGVLQTLDQLQGEHDRYMAWVAGNRAEKLATQGRENNLNAAEIAELKKLNAGKMADGRSRAAVYAKVHAEMREFNNSIIDIAHKSGLIDANTAAQFKSDAFYVPFYRELSDDGDFEGPKRVAALVNQKAFNKLKGRNMTTGDLLENVMMNWSHLLSASLKNQAARSTLEAAEQMGAAKRVTSDFKDSLKVMVNGNARHYAVEDAPIVAALRALTPSNVAWMKPLNATRMWLTRGVTISPAFKIRNLIRDTVTSLAVAPMGANPFKNVVEGIKLSGDEKLMATMLTGGGTFRFGTFNEGNRAAQIRDLLGAGTHPNTILDSPAKLAEFARVALHHYQELGDRGENANRAVLYKRLRDQGISHLEASYMSRDLMDFGLTGSGPLTRFFTSVVPFLNARLQGLYKIGRATAEDWQRVATVAGAVSLGSVALYLANRNDPDFQAREGWDRDNFWWFKMGDTAYRIPKPFEIGALGTLVERSVEQMIDDSAESKTFVQSLQNLLMDNFAFNPVPQVVRPALDLYANTDPFTQRQIESASMQNLPKEDRFGPNTSAPARILGSNPRLAGAAAGAAGGAALGNAYGGKAGALIGGALGAAAGSLVQLSPAQVDYLLRGYFGWVGETATDAADLALRPLTGQGERPEYHKIMGVPEQTFAGFAKTLPSDYSRYVTAFYQQHQDLRQMTAELQQLRASGSDGKIDAFMDANSDKLGLAPQYDAAAKQMASISQQIKNVTADQEMSASEKRAQLTDLYAQRNAIARDTETSRIDQQRGR